jgi:hypothetical protein
VYMYYEENRADNLWKYFENNTRHHIQKESHMRSIPDPYLGSIPGAETGHPTRFLVSFRSAATCMSDNTQFELTTGFTELLHLVTTTKNYALTALGLLSLIAFISRCLVTDSLLLCLSS